MSLEVNFNCFAPSTKAKHRLVLQIVTPFPCKTHCSNTSPPHPPAPSALKQMVHKATPKDLHSRDTFPHTAETDSFSIRTLTHKKRQWNVDLYAFRQHRHRVCRTRTTPEASIIYALASKCTPNWAHSLTHWAAQPDDKSGGMWVAFLQRHPSEVVDWARLGVKNSLHSVNCTSDKCLRLQHWQHPASPNPPGCILSGLHKADKG